MAARLLLASLLLWGTTGAAVCRAYCAHGAEFAGVAEGQARESSAPGSAPCHGHGEPTPASPTPVSQPGDSDGSDDTGCCPDLWFTADAEAFSLAAHAQAFLAQGTLLAVASSLERGRRAFAAAVPHEPLRSPFRTHNPPLLS